MHMLSFSPIPPAASVGKSEDSAPSSASCEIVRGDMKIDRQREREREGDRERERERREAFDWARLVG